MKLPHTVLGLYFVLNSCLAIILFINTNVMYQRKVRDTVCDINRIKSTRDNNPASFWL